MRSTPESPTSDLPPLGPAIKPAQPVPASRPTDVPGIRRQPDGRLETQIPVPSRPRVYFVADCFMGCIGGPNGPIEVHEDRWFIDGVDDEGYESEEEAEEARDALAGGAR